MCHKVLKLRPLLIILAIGFFGLAVYQIIEYKQAIMPKDHVYVCDNPNHESDFDNFLLESIKDPEGHTWVPTYIIIKDNYIIGSFNGGIDVDEFVDKLAVVAAYDLKFIELPNYQITNLNNERKSLQEIFTGNDLYILELSWYGCEDCAYQDENFTDDIYKKFSTSHIFRYYIKSDFDDVAKLY